VATTVYFPSKEVAVIAHPRLLTVTESDQMSYSFKNHKHNFAAWCASRAASSSTCRFRVKDGKAIIEEVGLQNLVLGVTIPTQPEKMDAFHSGLRQKVVQAALRHGFAFSDGIAAKLINVYLKAFLLLDQDGESPTIAELHPPVDREMLRALIASGLGNNELWCISQEVGWTHFSGPQYEAVIAGLRELLGPGTPLWMAEQYWPGYQE
jgi:hypothetical protein